MLLKKLTIMSLAAIFATTAVIADAKRMGGGRTVGAKRDTVTQRQSTPPANNAANTTSQAAPASAAVPAAAAAKTAAPAAAAKSGLSRWMPMLGGLAIGAALASMFGGGAFGQFMANALMILAMVMIALFVWRFIQSRRAGGSSATPALAGAGAAASAGAGYATQRTASDDVQFGGNRSAQAQPVAAPVVTEPVSTGIAPNVPAGFDVEGFARGSKAQFTRLQATFDSGNATTLKDMLTDEMYAEVDRELKSRGPNAAPTEIVMLNSEVIEVTSESDGHWASVRFHGLIREDGQSQAEAFDEVWNLMKPLNGDSGWLLAGIQQL